LVASGALAGVASAGDMPGVPPESPGPCSIELSGPGVSPDGVVESLPATVTVAGDVPAGATEVQLLISTPPSAAPVIVQTVAPVGLRYTFAPQLIQAESGLSVSYLFGNQNAYTTTCEGIGGLTVIRIRPAGAQAARPLAFTGSNDTLQYVLIGAGLLAVGSVLVVGARRRNRVRV